MVKHDFHPFELGVVPGIVVVNVFAVLSFFALVSVAVRVALQAIISRRKSDSARASPREYVFFQTQLGIYSICLLTANLFNSIAGVIGISWFRDMGITEGSVCVAQAAINQIGTWALAYFTITIAIHTFSSMVLRKRQSVWIASGVIVIGWCLAVAAAIFPMLVRTSQGSIYGDAGLSCGIRALYPKPQFLLHLFPIFLAALISVVLYSIVFLVLRGTLAIKGGLKFTLDPNRRWDWRIGTSDEYHHFVAAIARSMLWYPFAYVAFLLPYSIVRLLAMSGFAVPFGVTVFAFVCWFSLGFVNVFLLYNTFRVLGPAFNARLSIHTQKDTDSFFSPFKVTQTTPSLLGPGQLSASGMDERTAYMVPNRYPLQSGPYTLTHQSTPSNSSGVSARPLLSGYRRTSSDAQSLQRAISPYAELNQPLTATPEPAWRFRHLRVDTNDIRTGQTSTSSTSLTPAPRYNRSPFERRPTIESIPSSSKGSGDFDGPRPSFEGLDIRLNHRHPPLSAVAYQTSFGSSCTPTMTTTSDFVREFDYKPSPPPSAVVRPRQRPEYYYDYPSPANSSSTYGNMLEDVPPQLYSPGRTTRVLPAPAGKSKSARRPPVEFDANAMVQSVPSKPASTSPTAPTRTASSKLF